MRVLHVDDEEVDRRALLRALLRMSTSVELVQVATLGEALALLARGRFDKILLDLCLPDSDNPVPEIERAMGGADLLILTGADPGEAWDKASRYEIFLKSASRDPLKRAASLMRMLLSLPA